MIHLYFAKVWDGYLGIICEVMNIRSIAFPFFFKTLLRILKYLTSGFKLQMFLCHVQGDAQLFLPTTLKLSQVSHWAELCELILKSFKPGNCMGVARGKMNGSEFTQSLKKLPLLSCLLCACTCDGFALSIVLQCETQLQVIMGDTEKLWKIKTFIS